ncbi:hemolysin family protein [Magnetococcus sp. PR-3]|uniref:hemolysin family protein n=1 Tax=Magnetococcus sp. PR-3 TaxID=3120355 RepID=UPI002FCE4E96
METIGQLLIIAFFLVLKGFFSGSEIAMVNCDKLKMRHRAKLGDRGAQMVVQMFENPDIILGTTLVGTNIATVSISTMAALMFIDLYGGQGDLISVLVFTPFLLILGEIVPKSIYQQKADSIAPYIIYGLKFFSVLFYPVIFVFSRIARTTTRLVGGSSQQNGFITRDEIRMLLEMSDATPTGRRFDRDRVRRIIRFADTTVGEAMIPLADVVGVSEKASLEEAVERIWSQGFNRLPVYRGNLINIVGVCTVNSWSLMDPELDNKQLSDYTDPPLYLSPNQTIDQALPLLQARPSDHMGIVVDEFGSAAGILTMEDIFEEVVGEIDVGYDFDEYHPKRRVMFQELGEDDFVADGRIPLSQLNDKLHIHLPVGEAHTLAGLMMQRLKAIPKPDDEVFEQDYHFTVLEANDRTVTKVRIARA